MIQHDGEGLVVDDVVDVTGTGGEGWVSDGRITR